LAISVSNDSISEVSSYKIVLSPEQLLLVNESNLSVISSFNYSIEDLSNVKLNSSFSVYQTSLNSSSNSGRENKLIVDSSPIQVEHLSVRSYSGI